MASNCTEAIPTQMSDPVVEPNVPPIPSTSSDTDANQNRLIHYVRSMPLVSLLFGRNVPPGSLPNEPNRSFIFKCLMIFHLIILVALIGLSTFAIYYYNIRFYKTQTRPSETLIVCWLLRAIWHTINSSWALRYYVSNITNRPNLKLSQAFYNIASILWISLTVVFLGVSPREDLKSASARICYFLLWITIASYVVPMLAYTIICILLYITLLVVIFFRHGSISLTSLGVPPQLLKKLKVERYKDVLKRIDLSNLDSSDIDEMKKNNEYKDNKIKINKNKVGSNDIKPIITDSQSTINSIKEGFTDCVNNDDMLNERLCCICILNIKDDDKVYLLPCDIRHLFHRDCLNKWFKRSSECPICRCNITDILSEKKEAAQEGGLNEGETNTQSEVSGDSLIEIVIDNVNYEDAFEDLPKLQDEQEVCNNNNSRNTKDKKEDNNTNNSMNSNKSNTNSNTNTQNKENRDYYYKREMSDVSYRIDGFKSIMTPRQESENVELERTDIGTIDINRIDLDTTDLELGNTSRSSSYEQSSSRSDYKSKTTNEENKRKTI